MSYDVTFQRHAHYSKTREHLIEYFHKGGRALRGFFGPHMRSKNENCCHKFLLISLLEQ